MTRRQKLAEAILMHTLLLIISLTFAGCGGEEVVEKQADIGAITDLVISGETLYAVSAGRGVFRLEHGKNSWETMNIFHVRSLTVAGKTLYAGTMNGKIFRLEEGNNLWTQLPSLPQRKGPIGPLVASGKSLYASHEFEKGLYRLDDEGDSWKQIDGGWENGHVVFLGVSGTVLYVSTIWSNTLVSNDRGNSWTPISSEISLLRIVSEEILYGQTSEEGIMYSKNGGKEWIPIGPTDLSIYALVLSGGTFFAGTNDGIFRFESGNNSWTQTGLDGLPVLSLAVLETTLYAGATFDGVFRSEDGGYSWQAINQGLALVEHGE